MSLLRPLITRGKSSLRPIHFRSLATAVDPAVNQSQAHSHHIGGDHVRLVEVGPRDGLQNEKKSIPLETKITLIEKLSRTGLTEIEAGSFVPPKWVPQMAASDQILEHILNSPPQTSSRIAYSFLAPNIRGLENATSILQRYPECYIKETDTSYQSHTNNSSSNGLSQQIPSIEIAVFAAATETFSKKNLNCDIETSLLRFKDVIQGAKAAGMRVRAYISVVLGCPFEGRDVDPQRVAEIATDLLEMGADEISLGDTTGMGTGPSTRLLLKAMQAAGVRNEDIACHFHDTYGQALVNTAVSLEHGIRTFDSSVGGLGGCPYSPGATGNVATEDMVYFLDSLGMRTGVDLDNLAEIGEWISGEIGRENASSVGRAILGARRRGS